MICHFLTIRSFFAISMLLSNFQMFEPEEFYNLYRICVQLHIIIVYTVQYIVQCTQCNRGSYRLPKMLNLLEFNFFVQYDFTE